MSLLLHKEPKSWKYRTVQSLIIAAALTGIGFATVNVIESHHSSTVSASSYDINGYIKSKSIKPNTSFDKDLHSFSMFHYSTADKLPNGIVFHWTASESSKDTAVNEAAYEINGHWENAFVHTFIDHQHILNIHDTNYGAWGAGPKANARFVQFELCTETTESGFAQSIANAAYYAAYICHQYGMKPTLGPNGTIWTHHQVTEYLGGTTHVDPDSYLARWNYNTSKFLTLVKQYYNAMTSKSASGSSLTYNQYVTIKKNYPLWSNLTWTKKKGTTGQYVGKMLYAKYVYGNSNGSRYLSLYDNKNKWVGYVNEDAATVSDNPQGKYISYGKYVTLTKSGYNLYKSFSWSKTGQTSTTRLNKTYLAKGEYKHFNGSTYYTLYDGAGKWQGYVNSSAASVANNAGGVGQKISTYITPTTSSYTLWGNFSWTKKRGKTSDYANRTLEAKLSYNNVNGSSYYSVYDNNGKWLGYANIAAFSKVSAQGKYISLNKYVTLTKSGYTIWGDFSWNKEIGSSSYLLNQTYLAKGEYKHFNGSTYLSIYDNSGKWLGYVNQNVGKLAGTAGGNAINLGKTVNIARKGYTMWGNLNFSRKTGNTSSYLNKNVYAKYRYNHINGSTYLSIYSSSNGTWLGYINANATMAEEVTVKPVTVPSNLYGINTSKLSTSQKTFLKNLLAYAIPVAKKYNIYPSILVMQAAKESAWGTSELVKNANAYFGIKADATWFGDSYTKTTTEVENGKTLTVNSAFRKYSSLGGSVEGYARKVTTSGLYPGLLKSNSSSWKTAVNALKIYATATDYVSSITNGINTYRFDLLDSVK
jgi:N-acetylmuramoyl-L-alanine amidase CwlA